MLAAPRPGQFATLHQFADWDIQFARYVDRTEQSLSQRLAMLTTTVVTFPVRRADCASRAPRPQR